MTSFQSVGTAAARFQDISLNPQKLAGQCAKLKCCLNFEIDAYVEGMKRMPAKDVRLETADNTWYHFKHDVFKRLITYSTDKSIPANLTTISAARAFEIIQMNRDGEKPLTLEPEGKAAEQQRGNYSDILGQDSINRFDNKKKKRKNKGGNGNRDRQNSDDHSRQQGDEKKQETKGLNGEERQRRNRDNRRRGKSKVGNNSTGGELKSGGEKTTGRQPSE